MLRKITAELITQLIEVSSKLSNEEFTRPVQLLQGNSVGKHTRHIIEFYGCLLYGYETGTVNYDAREHNALLENDKTLTINALQNIKDQLNNFTEKPLTLLFNFSDNSEKENSINTTFERELLYNIEHVLHHAAIIKIALINCFPLLLIPENFGIAYSTVRFNKKQKETLDIHK